MSTYLTFGRFNEVNEKDFSQDVLDLYKKRDDHSISHFNANGWKPFYNPRSIFLTYTNTMISKPSEPEYYNLTDYERLEKGLPTRFDLFYKSPLGMISFGIFGTFALRNFSKMNSPNGVILRRGINLSLFTKFM